MIKPAAGAAFSTTKAQWGAESAAADQLRMRGALPDVVDINGRAGTKAQKCSSSLIFYSFVAASATKHEKSRELGGLRAELSSRDQVLPCNSQAVGEAALAADLIAA